jgi:hypothetical protein
MLIIFFDIMGIVYKEFVLASQTVNSIYYCDVLRRLHENVRRLRPELWQQKNWVLHHDNAPSHTSFYHHEIFDQKQHYCRPRLKKKLKGRHFYTIGDGGRNAGGDHLPSELDFPDSFKKWQKSCFEGGGCQLAQI